MTTTTALPTSSAAPSTATSAIPAPLPPLAHPSAATVRAAIAKRSFCTLATTSPGGRAHVAGVLYAPDGDTLLVSTLRTSRKARNIAASATVAVCIPVRRLPVGPPSSIQFQGTAEVVALDDPVVTRLAEAGTLKAITSHGELDLPDGCFVRITVPQVVHTYGLGLSLWKLVREPLRAGARVELADVAPRS